MNAYCPSAVDAAAERGGGGLGLGDNAIGVVGGVRVDEADCGGEGGERNDGEGEGEVLGGVGFGSGGASEGEVGGRGGERLEDTQRRGVAEEPHIGFE